MSQPGLLQHRNTSYIKKPESLVPNWLPSKTHSNMVVSNKPQIPISKFQISTKLQFSNPETNDVLNFGFSSLEIIWDFVLGIWNFASSSFPRLSPVCGRAMNYPAANSLIWATISSFVNPFRSMEPDRQEAVQAPHPLHRALLIWATSFSPTIVLFEMISIAL